jgi:hypothetical protein
LGALTITTTRRCRFTIHVAGGLPTSRVCVIVRRAAADVTKWRDLRCADEMVFDCARRGAPIARYHVSIVAGLAAEPDAVATRAVCVCVCVRERERERGREGGREGERVCVRVRVCACACACAFVLARATCTQRPLISRDKTKSTRTAHKHKQPGARGPGAPEPRFAGADKAAVGVCAISLAVTWLLHAVSIELAHVCVWMCVRVCCVCISVRVCCVCCACTCICIDESMCV